MAQKFPKDADGDALRRVAGDGSDMSQPMEVDFFVAVPDEATGRRVEAAATAAGFRSSVEADQESGDWTCYCSKDMVASYDNVVNEQGVLQRLAEPLGGEVDGWGTEGN